MVHSWKQATLPETPRNEMAVSMKWASFWGCPCTKSPTILTSLSRCVAILGQSKAGTSEASWTAAL